MNTRRWLSLTAAATTAAALVLATAGCSQSTDSKPQSADSGKPVTISFWGWVPGIEDAVDLWNKSHPKIQVKFTRIASSDAASLPTKIKAGTAPDVAQIAVHDLPTYVINQQVEDLTSYIGKDKKDYAPSAWNGVEFDGKDYAVPQDSSPTALMYRKDIFSQYGLTPPKTWDEYQADAKKLHDANPNIYLGQFSPNEPSMFYGDQIQAGGSWYGTSGNSWKVEIDNAKSQAVADRYQSLLDQHLLKVEQMWSPEYWADVNNGVIASINYAAWFPVLVEQNAPKLSGDWAVAPSPSESGDGPYADLGGSVDAVLKGSKHAEQASEFLTWLNSDPDSLSILITKGGLFPAAKSGLKNTALNATSDYWGGQNISSVFAADLKNVSTSAVEGPGYEAAYSALGDALGKAANGQTTIGEALTQTGQTMRDNIKKLGLSVK